MLLFLWHTAFIGNHSDMGVITHQSVRVERLARGGARSLCFRFRRSLGALHGALPEPMKGGDLNANYRIKVRHLWYLPEQLHRWD